MFLNKNNTRDISARLGRYAVPEMKKWVSVRQLNKYSSVQNNHIEVLDFINKEFINAHKNKPYELNMAKGQDYPKYYIDEGVERYNVDDFRAHDAQSTQEVTRSNDNFRYNNEIKLWNRSAHIRNYDRDEHENGLRDTRELNTLSKGYNMEKIYGENPYKSSESYMYDYK
jgi:hypothetical protein